MDQRTSFKLIPNDQTPIEQMTGDERADAAFLIAGIQSLARCLTPRLAGKSLILLPSGAVYFADMVQIEGGRLVSEKANA